MATNQRHYDHGSPEPTVQNRCPDCGKVHYDERFDVCRDCGSPL